MIDTVSFDILLIGLTTPGESGHARYANAMARLTGRTEEEFGSPSPSFDEPIFSSLDHGTAEVVARTLGEAGGLIEVRTSTAIARNIGDQVVPTDTCPTCGFVQPAGGNECSKCGLVFSKFEREQVQTMQKDRGLEEAIATAMKVREEWDLRANQYLETHAFPDNHLEGFASVVMRGEVPFRRLDSDEGSLLLTSRRLLAQHKGDDLSIPYEMIADVTFGGGLVATKKKTRMLLSFSSPLPKADGTVKSLSWMLDKEASFHKDVVMDWAFSRTFMCGACGARDLDFRTDDTIPCCRCMHCATDHRVDLREALAIPAAVE